MLNGVFRVVTTFGVAVSLCAGPALATASAAAVPARSISPMVALSIFGSQASAAALCGSSVTTAASAAATAQAPAGGCVLPVVDAPPPLPIAEAPMLPPPAPSGFGLTPILLGLAGIAILAALLLSDDDDDDDDDGPPMSVN